MTEVTRSLVRTQRRAAIQPADILLSCGILSSLLYVATDIMAALRWPAYRFDSQAVSELMAIGAPTRPFMIPLFFTYGILVIAYAIGVWIGSSRKLSLRIAASLLLVYGVAGEVGLLFFPMHLRGTEGSLTDILHIIDTSVLVIATLLIIGFGSLAGGSWFRVYSIGTIVSLVVFGALAGAQGPRLAAQLPTPWLGIEERINIYGSMLWIALFAVVLLRAPNHASVVTRRKLL
jgi:hypothetical protein